MNEDRMKRITDFVEVARLYRAGGNTIRYSLLSAWRIAVRGLPF